MADTDAVYITTDEYYDVYGQTNPSVASNVETLWNDEVAQNDNYTLSVSTDSGLDLNQTDTISNALSEAQSSMKVQTHLNTNGADAVVVVDARSYPNYDGMAYTNAAGTNYGVGIVSPEKVQEASHELAHIYGGSHGEFENFGWFSKTVMAESSATSCNGNDPATVREHTFSDCTIGTIRNNSVF